MYYQNFAFALQQQIVQFGLQHNIMQLDFADYSHADISVKDSNLSVLFPYFQQGLSVLLPIVIAAEYIALLFFTPHANGHIQLIILDPYDQRTSIQTRMNYVSFHFKAVGQMYFRSFAMEHHCHAFPYNPAIAISSRLLEMLIHALRNRILPQPSPVAIILSDVPTAMEIDAPMAALPLTPLAVVANRVTPAARRKSSAESPLPPPGVNSFPSLDSSTSTLDAAPPAVRPRLTARRAALAPAAEPDRAPGIEGPLKFIDFLNELIPKTLVERQKLLLEKNFHDQGPSFLSAGEMKIVSSEYLKFLREPNTLNLSELSEKLSKLISAQLY